MRTRKSREKEYFLFLFSVQIFRCHVYYGAFRKAKKILRIHFLLLLSCMHGGVVIPRIDACRVRERVSAAACGTDEVAVLSVCTSPLFSVRFIFIPCFFF